jgi:hypothetical protein
VPQIQIARQAEVSRMKYNEELTKAGVLLAGEGLQPSSLRQMPPRQVLKSIPGSEA